MRCSAKEFPKGASSTPKEDVKAVTMFMQKQSPLASTAEPLHPYRLPPPDGLSIQHSMFATELSCSSTVERTLGTSDD